jgi:outer membrane protein
VTSDEGVQLLMKSILTLVIAGALVLAAADAAAQSVKVGYVNLARIEKESASFARSMKSLNEEFEPRTRQLQEFQKRIAAARAQFESEQAKLAPAEAQARTREIESMMRESDQNVLRVSEDYELRRRQLRAKLLEDVRGAIKIIVSAGKYDVILQEAVFAGPGVDVTDQVLKAMAK